MSVVTISPERSSSVALPRRSRVSIFVPVLVLLLTAALVVWSAWPVLRPARPIVAVQAIMGAPSGVAEGLDLGDQVPRGPTVQAAGWVEPEPYSIACTALADGIVESIDVLEGDKVEQGQVVARLIAADAELRFRRAEGALGGAQSDVARAEAELRAATVSWEEPVELDRAIETGRAMLAGSEAELAQLPMRIQSARADLTRLEAEFDWMVRTASDGAATELELVAARERAAAQNAEVAFLEASRPVLEARIQQHRSELRAAERGLALRIEDRRRVDSAQSELAAADARFQVAAAERDEAALELERMTIRAPISGTVMRRYKSPGDKVVRGMDDPYSAHILHLYDPALLQIRVDVPLADVSAVSIGQACEIVVEALPGETLRGEVTRVMHEADVQKNTLEVKVRVVDPPSLVCPEMLARVKFLPGSGGSAPNATPNGSVRASVQVPSETLWSRDGGSHVWMVTQRRAGRGVLRAVPVERLGEREGWVSVVGELQPGALLAVTQEGLREGQPVVVEASGQEGGS